MRSRGLLFAGGAVVGAAAGWVLAQRRLTFHRRDLFSPRPMRRLAALGYLAGQGGVETAQPAAGLPGLGAAADAAPPGRGHPQAVGVHPGMRGHR